jgi:cellulose synthase/poly-beta-1,6-N-acetylglucosamine synthase-like glycosyltransferase
MVSARRRIEAQARAECRNPGQQLKEERSIGMWTNALAWAAIAFSLFILIELLRLNFLLYTILKQEPNLSDADVSSHTPLPLVSIVIPAKDEQLTIEQTVRSILASDHERLELILVDDRSADRTLEIMNQLATEDPRIRVLSVKELPEGWTGKTHAMFRGAEIATGDILLFSDADTVLSPLTLTRTLRFFVRERLDVLCLLPGFTERRFSENVVYLHLALGFSYFYPLSEVNDASKPAAMASGCFIMVGKQAYQRLGSWKRFRREITEDVAFSKAAKKSGLKMRLLRGYPLVRTKPFEEVGAVCRFWKRTFYGGFEKSIPKISRLIVNYTALTALSLIFLWSGLVCLAGSPSTEVGLLFLVSGLAMAAVIIPTCLLIKQDGGRWFYGLTTPIGVVISAWVAWSTLLVVITDRGILWRGQLYK